MAFSREFLKSLSLTDDQVTAIIQEHTSVTDALKAQRDKAKEEAAEYKKTADKLPDVQKELDELKSGEDFKTKYEQEHKDFEDYKSEIAKNEQLTKVKAAYRKLLADEHINEKRLDAVIKLTDFSEMKLDKDGNLENLDGLKKTIADEWGEYKTTVKEVKPKVATPPKDGSTGTGMSRARELAQKYHEQRYGKPAGKE